MKLLRKSNAKSCKDYKQKEKLNDPSFGEKEIIKTTKRKKENQSESEIITQHEKEA